jgi:hypothetical protein
MPTSLSLHFWEMQGYFDEMQGGVRAKSCQISKAWMGLSLIQDQGGYPSLAKGGESLWHPGSAVRSRAIPITLRRGRGGR